MHKLAIIGLFCEDIREEIGETFTLIGLMPDNVTVAPTPPGTGNHSAGTVSPTQGSRILEKIGIFVRANFDPNDPVESISLALHLPNGTRLAIGGANSDVVGRAKSEAEEKSLLLAGIIMRVLLGGFRLPSSGDLVLEAMIHSQGKKKPEKRVIAAMKLARLPDTSAADAATVS